MSNLLYMALVLGCGFFMNGCQSCHLDGINSIKSFNHVSFDHIKGDQTLVLFDVDETLIQPQDIYFLHEHKPMGRLLRKKLVENHPHEDWNTLQQLASIQEKRPLIEESVLEKVKILRENNVKVMALSAMNTGSYGFLESLEKWRYEHLKSLGFEADFNDLLFKLEGFKRNPAFYQGIILTDLEDKGKILGTVLDHLNYHPEKVIFFDDDYAMLQSVLAECQKRDIDFCGYHYQGAKIKPWDHDIVNYQIEHLRLNKQWLSDDEVLKILNK